MGAQFTPGPWTAYDFGADWYVGTQADDSGPMLRVGSIHADREANANLIAAAPELYEALELFARLEVPAKPEGNAGAYSIPFDRIRKAQSALAKARGEA